ncbi:hypothetical protein DPMN_141227 [Dreissena polymorpha]|uniref:Secreted protein n=1 Tax=Dreissena polymorpha TaxID=45954 RepID=A0A9D4G9K5_DREPO|nr:hypothetical protein DPMN_141227 [Dreissena polymorpha]
MWPMWAGSWVLLKQNFGWVWSMWAGRPGVGNGAIHNVHYQYEVNRKTAPPPITFDPGFQCSSANNDERTERGDNHNIPTQWANACGTISWLDICRGVQKQRPPWTQNRGGTTWPTTDITRRHQTQPDTTRHNEAQP